MTFYHRSHDDAARAFRIKQLNDGLRIFGRKGKRYLTTELEAYPMKTITRICDAVRAHSDWSEDTDPYGTHDYGELIVDGIYVVWSIRYSDRARKCGAFDPSDPETTRRALTIGLLKR